MKFNEIIENKSILQVLNEMNFEEATKIQEEIIPFILDGSDVLGQSQTGTGKTMAFALPVLEKIEQNKKIQTLILTPTRELAIQIEREFTKLSKYMNIKSIAVYGSSSIEEQIKAIKNGAEIIIGTPGRTKDLIKRKILKLTEIKYFVLDEADEMLSMGFQEELEFIFDKINNDKQVLLFSATMPKSILNIAKKYMSSDYKMVTISTEDETPKNLVQEYYLVNSKSKLESLSRIIDYYNPKKCIIFCRTKRNADDVLDKLLGKGYNANVIHGDITQSQRIQTLDQFKVGAFNYLIATDVAARGIHVDDVDIVVNFSLPENTEAYVHRIGRTGRINKSGLALTIILPSEECTIKKIAKKVKSEIIKKDLPTKEDIFTTRTSSIIENAKNFENSLNTNHLFDDYIDSISLEQMKNVLRELLQKELNDTVGSDFSENITVKQKKKNKNRISPDSTRIFITIGKMDNIEKRDFLCFMEKTAKIKEGNITNLEILPKFTFASVNNKVLEDVLKKCNNIKYNNRIMKIEVANK